VISATIKKSGITILVIGILAMFTPEDVNAGCIGNPPFCASYIKGSVICQGLKNGLGKKKFCLNEQDCGEVMCGITGIVDTNGVETADCNDNDCTFTTNPTCAIPVDAICNNHGGGSGGEGQSFTLEGVITGAASQATCPKPGTCLFSALLNTDAQLVCRNPNWTVVDSSVGPFKGKACYCSNNQLGVTDTTVFDNFCQDGTLALCITEVCELNGSAYNCHAPSGGACQ
jgi:hypothetical protein